MKIDISKNKKKLLTGILLLIAIKFGVLTIMKHYWFVRVPVSTKNIF